MHFVWLFFVFFFFNLKVCLRVSIIASQWVYEMRKKHLETKQLLRQKKQNRTVRLGGKQTPPHC